MLWHGWLPVLSGVNGAASYLVEAALGCYSSGVLTEWGLPDEYDRVEVASLVPDHPNVWSDCSLVLDQVAGVSSSGAGFCALQSENCWSGRRWGHVDGVHPEGEFQSCLGFCSVHGPLQSVQRPEMWVSFWHCSLLLLFIWELTIWVLSSA